MGGFLRHRGRGRGSSEGVIRVPRGISLETANTAPSCSDRASYSRRVAAFTGPPSLFERTDELHGWVMRSHDWIGTLKPKPTTKG